MTKHFVIIGTGIGGCCMAALLSRDGHTVTILEARDNVGGLCNLETDPDGKYRFDTGPSIILMLEIFEQFFEKLGTTLCDHIEVLECTPATELYIDDEVLTMDHDNRSVIVDQETSRGMDEVHTRTMIDQYEERSRYLYDETMNYVLRRIFKWSHLLTLELYAKMLGLGIVSTQTTMLKRYFSSSVVHQALSYHCMFMGDPPNKSPSTFALLDHSMRQGVYYFKGGLNVVCTTLLDMALQWGATLQLSSCVTGFTNDGRRITEVLYTHHGSTHVLDNFDDIVCNGNLPAMTFKLPRYPFDFIPRMRIQNMKYTCSTISFHWGINDPLDGFKSHMFFSQGDFEANMSATLQERMVNPTLYLHTPSIVDPTAAPQGKHAMIVLIPVPYLKDKSDNTIDAIDGSTSDSIDWETVTATLRRRAFNIIKEKMNIDLEPLIEHEKVCTPVEWRDQYHTYRGAPLGLGHGMTQLAMLRPSPRHHWFRNMYFVGTSTQPGTGLPMIMRGAELIYDEYFSNEYKLL